MMEAVEVAVHLHLGSIPMLAMECTSKLQEMMREARHNCLERIGEQVQIECEQTFTVNHYYSDNVAKMSDGYCVKELSAKIQQRLKAYLSLNPNLL